MVAKDGSNGEEQRLIEAARRQAAQLRAAGAGGSSGSGSSPAGVPAQIGAEADSFPGYRILREIQRGGQGVVYQALQESTQRKVAIKVVREGALASSEARARFEREVAVLGRLDHPSIVTIHDSGVAQGCPFFVMDYVPGQPLDVWGASGERSVRQVLELFAGICEAVNAAHLVGIVHRDLKPGNVRIDPDGKPHVLDFGLAKLAGTWGTEISTGAIGAGAPAMTTTGQFVGSLPWSSPEQAGGGSDRVDLRTDVYSLGVMLYQMLSGRFPYEVVGNLVDVVRTIQGAEPVKPRTLRREIDDEVETILLTCLQKERDRRYQTAGELARDLRRYLAGAPISAKRDSALYLARKVLRRHWLPAAVAVAFVVLVTVGLVVTWGLYGTARVERDRAAAAGTAARGAQVAAERDRGRLAQSLYYHRMLLSQYAVEENNGERAQALLAECPEELRGWEWHRMRWLVDRSRLRLAGHEDTITAVAFGPGGRRVASAGSDGVRVWHAASGFLERTFSQHADEVTRVDFDVDGEHVVSGDESGAVLRWSVTSGAVVDELVQGGAGISALARSADGRRLAIGDRSGTVRLLETGAAGRRTWGGLVPDGPVTALAFTPDGEALLVGGEEGFLVRWSLSTGAVTQRFEGVTGDVAAITVRPDGARMVTGGGDGRLRVWDLASGEQLVSVVAHRPWLYGVDYDPYGRRVLTCGADHTIKLWDPATGELLKTLRGHTDQVFAATFDVDGRSIASGGADRDLCLWDPDAPESARVYPGHRDQAWTVRCSPDGRRLATASTDGTAKVWSAHDENVLPRTLEGHGGRVIALAFSADGRQVATGGADGTLRLWDPETGDELRRFAEPGGMTFAVDFDPHGERLVSLGADGTVREWDVRTGEALRSWSAGRALFTGAYRPDGARFATGDMSGVLAVWDAETGERLFEQRTPGGQLWRLAWSADGARIATAHHGGVARVWDAESGTVLAELHGHRGGVRCVAFWPDGSRVVTGGWDETLRVWDAESGAEALILRGHGCRIESVAVTPDGTAIVSTDVEGGLRLWESGQSR